MRQPHDKRPDRRSLVVVSNRLPWNLPRDPATRAPKRNVGGLVTALEPVLAAYGGCWVGWDGVSLPSGRAVAEAMEHPREYRTPAGVHLHGVPLSEREVALHYNGFCNRALWPLFHDFPGRAVFAPEEFRAFEGVNRRFAEAARERASSGGRIWIHDFHLMLAPAYLREAGFTGRIDFFLHIPFPPPEIFRALPWREQLLRGLLAADGVAFHVPLYRDNFVRCAVELTGAGAGRAVGDGAVPLTRGAASTLARAVPIGIPVEEFERIAALPRVEARARRLREAHGNRRLVLSVDRLDYTKGILERLQVIEHHLAAHPESLGRVVFLEIVVPSRHQVEEYRRMKREIDREVGRINGEYAREGWMPVHYRYTALEREDLVAHYLAADVAMVTPLRDGMNLVASEFAAARRDEDGVLMVSEFAGIAGRSPGAILVNPWDLDGSAAGLAAALGMDPAERRRRMILLRERVRSNPVTRWARRCLEIEGEPGHAVSGEAARDADARPGWMESR